jgi:hypothetical protein
MPRVICQLWEEAEAGWGTRPDGYSIHLKEEDRITYQNAYGEYLVETYGRSAPPEYDRMFGEPFEKLVTNEEFDELMKKRISKKGFDRKYQRYGTRFYGSWPKR